jgi:hypothetical protein
VELKAGTRLRSQVCTTEVIIVKASAADLALTCGGAPLVAMNAEVTPGQTPVAGLNTGTQIGKRYTTADDHSLEVLVTKPGLGALAVGDVPLVFKEAKPLPASD